MARRYDYGHHFRKHKGMITSFIIHKVDGRIGNSAGLKLIHSVGREAVSRGAMCFTSSWPL
jgi:hypothetical protein